MKTNQMFSVDTAPEELGNGGLTFETHQTFSVYTARRNLETEVTPVQPPK